MIEKHLKIMV